MSISTGNQRCAVWGSGRRGTATCLERIPQYHHHSFSWKQVDFQPSSESILIGRLQPHITMSPAEVALLRVNLTLFEAAVHCYNPFFMDYGNNVLYNMKQGGLANSSLFPGIAATKVVWVKRTLAGSATLRHTILDAEDARGVTLRGKRMAVFIRYRAHSRKDVWLAHLTPPFKEVKLKYKNRTYSEGNWLPFVYNDQLFVTYSLCPHRVLSVNPETGHCQLAYETVPARCSRFDRGSATGFVDEHGMTVGVGHHKSSSVWYYHFLFRRLNTPPFEIVDRSADFRFPVWFNARPSWDRIQFCLSMRQVGGSVAMDYSVQDAIALTIHMPRWQYCNFTRWC
uniref:Uncharacterized protein n=1 Tax=Chrysotila carterae TaxID=13221 RepID=A0A7S4FAY7_CHRCT|mmetsp:Transcript_5528/g.12040  ORF Transcript_5528/g.12040 Transcript_5528/m.12040 type:complete len:340 (-) Transcript_5528:306-1325(-)